VNDFPPKLWWYAGCLATAVAAIAAALLLAGDHPGLSPLLVLGALTLYSTHRKVQLPNGIDVSPGFMIGMTGVVVFQGQNSLAGPLILGAIAGLSMRGLSRRAWGWMPFDSGVAGLGNLAAAATYAAIPSFARFRMPVALVGGVVPALAYAITSWALVMFSYAVEQGRVPREVMSSAGAGLVQVMPFAIVGFLLGRLYLALGPSVVVLIIVPILIAREMFASYMRVKESHEETVHMLIRALEQKDRYTAGHAERVAEYARYIGESLNFMPSRMERLRFAALMHDIGKLVVPNQLLNKPGRLTADEFELVRVHEKVSVQMLDHIDFLRPIAGAGHSENTRFDPDDSDHPIEPYIVMIADAYDAMTSTRAYRKALTQEVAFGELRDKAGIQFHPACVEALISVIEARGEKHGAGHEQSDEFEDAPHVGVGSAGLGDLMSSETG